jgi:hypothetical protein
LEIRRTLAKPARILPPRRCLHRRPTISHSQPAPFLKRRKKGNMREIHICASSSLLLFFPFPALDLCPLLLHFFLPHCWRACDPARLRIHSGGERVTPAGASGTRCQPGCMRRGCVLSSLLLLSLSALPAPRCPLPVLRQTYPLSSTLPLPPPPCPQLLPVLDLPSPKVLTYLDEEWFRRSDTRTNSLLALFLPALSPHASFFFLTLLLLPPLFFCDTNSLAVAHG